jgi:hypothetical protein
MIAILQGGYLLSSAKRDITAMRRAAEAALRLLETYASEAPHAAQPLGQEDLR